MRSGSETASTPGAAGARYRRLDVPRLDHFERTSVYYTASQAEALLCAGDPVAIVGGGNSAGPFTGWLGGLVDLDDDGFVRTGRDTG